MTKDQDEPNVAGWNWNPALCPPDEQFIEWLNKYAIPEDVVFHMGTGMHHKVGIACLDLGIKCFGITISREEEAAFQRAWEPGYQVLFGDIAKVDFTTLPDITILTLFHIGEMPGTFTEIDQEQLLRIINSVKRGAVIGFYTRSAAWGRIKEIFAPISENNDVVSLNTVWRDLVFYFKT